MRHEADVVDRHHQAFARGQSGRAEGRAVHDVHGAEQPFLEQRRAFGAPEPAHQGRRKVAEGQPHPLRGGELRPRIVRMDDVVEDGIEAIASAAGRRGPGPRRAGRRTVHPRPAPRESRLRSMPMRTASSEARQGRLPDALEERRGSGGPWPRREESGAGAGTAGQVCRASRVPCHHLQRAGDAVGVRGSKSSAASPATSKSPVPCRGEDGAAHLHGLDERDAEALEQRRVHQAHRTRVERGQIAAAGCSQASAPRRAVRGCSTSASSRTGATARLAREHQAEIADDRGHGRGQGPAAGARDSCGARRWRDRKRSAAAARSGAAPRPPALPRPPSRRRGPAPPRSR